MIYQRNYDLEKIQESLKVQTDIYKRMHEDQRQHYASYFKVELLGNGHTEEFRNKTFILRAAALEDKLTIEDELMERFDEKLIFIEDKWPTEE